MKVSRISFPTNSPSQGFSAGRVYLDMIDGVLNTVTDGVATPVGDVPVTYASDDLTDKTAAGVAMFTAVDAAAQLALLDPQAADIGDATAAGIALVTAATAADQLAAIGGAGKYLRVVNDTDDALTIGLTYHAAYIRRTSANPNTITIPKQSVVTWVDGTYFTVKNVGAGTLTITPVDGDVTIIGTAAVLQSAYVRVVRVAANTWEILPG